MMGLGSLIPIVQGSLESVGLGTIMVHYGFVERRKRCRRKTFSNVSNTSPGHNRYNYRLSLLTEVIGTIITSSLAQNNINTVM